LTITNSNSGTDTQTSCDTYTWIDGNTYTTSNNSATWILTNAAGCDSTVTLDLTINNTPSFTISGTDPSVCNASDGIITISGLNANTSYTLSYDSLSIASQSAVITTDASGDYVLLGLSAGLYANFSISLNGCEYTSVDVIDLNNPGAPIIDNQSSLTECDTYTLADITGSNLSGNESYYTQANGGGTPLNAGDVISATQTIYIYDILGTCADESSFMVTIDYTPSLTDPGPQDSCESYFLPLSISGTNLSGNENYYSDLQSNGGTVISDEITSSQTVYIYDVNGACSNEISFEITINALPTLASFTGEGTYCEGDAINSLFAEVSGTPDYTLEYTLDGNPLSITSSNSSIVLGNTSGVYILTALNDYFCSVSINAMQTITINSIPNMPIVSGDTSYCENAEVADIQVSEGLLSPTWYSDAALSQIIGNSESLTPSVILGATTYYITSTENDCESPAAEVTITFEICEIIIPTAFTPDDDQINDTWELGNIDEIYPKNVVSIYNRWGNKIYESTQGTYNQNSWNGIYNGNKLPVGSYYYIIEFNDNYTQNTNGTVSILKD
ncbi:MAG: gliding motility-associated C-terminal domain-containing protein, partial [Crocinitomicaceae bacterium]|nr:gliding motility-associated C-terminal domain-containing protein [Crocinitomicaceae bacterium]